jgi:uncharacterized SAM-binding protein YcdF (DUF218 family)
LKERPGVPRTHPKSGSAAGDSKSVHWSHAASGCILATLTIFAANEVVGGVLRLSDWVGFVLALAGALIGLTKARRVLWWIAGFFLAAFAVLGWTPFLDGPMRQWVRSDPPRRADAVVVLSSDVRRDGKPLRVAQIRLLAGYEEISARRAPVLVITRLEPPKRSLLPFVREQLKTLRATAEVVEAPRAVGNTRDEAKELAALSKRRGWKRLILVTDSLHLRRAASLFEHEGLEVVCRPCLENDFELDDLRPGTERLLAFRAWSHEVVGWQTYRIRGWLK